MMKNKIFKDYVQRKRTSFAIFEFENLIFGLRLFYIIDSFTMLYVFSYECLF